MARLAFLPLLLLAVLTCCHCAPAQPPSQLGPSWRDQYTHHSPDSHWLTVLGTYYLDKRFSVQRKQQIMLAVENWNLVLNGRVKYNLANDGVDFSDPIGAVTFEATHELSDAFPVFFVWEDATDPTLPPAALAYVEELGSPVVHLIDGRLNFTLSPEVVVMHEIGHSFGLDHSPVPSTLMATTYERQPLCVDEVTVRTLAALHKWDADTLNWCQVR